MGILPLYLLKKWYKRLSSHVIPFSSDTDSEKSSLSSNSVIQVLLQFGGGVLFATVFTHLIPEIKESYEDYLKTNESIFKNSGAEEKFNKIPFVEITICGGFFLIFLIEEVMHYFLNRFNEHQQIHHNCYNRDLITRGSSLCSDNHEIQTEVKPISGAYVNYGTDTKTERNGRRSSYVKTSISTVCVSTDSVTNLTKPDYKEKEEKNWFIIMFFRGLVIIFAFSVHSIFDGLAIGLQNTSSDLWSMFFAISVHKLVIAFVVSMQLFDQSNRMVLVAILMGLFSIMSPIGILIVVLTEDSLLGEDSEANPVVILLTSIATGTLLYIIFYEILQKDRCEHISGFVQFLSILVGFGLMLTINILLSV